MRIKQIILHLAFTVFLALVYSCTGGNKLQNTNFLTDGKQQDFGKRQETEILLDYWENQDNRLNGNFPSVISAEEVYGEMNDKTLVIDMRNQKVFSEGHIPGAVNVGLDSLAEFFSGVINPDDYTRIILACYSGQSASYAASVLRFMGYGNVFPLRWGMSGWNQAVNNQWSSGISSDYTEALEKSGNSKPENKKYPKLNTGKFLAEEILKDRTTAVLDEYSDATITAESVFSDPGKYYIIHYDCREKYDSGHIPGAVWHNPNGIKGIIQEMQSIPPEKEVVIYSDMGHNSAMVTACLRIFGYHAKNLRFGCNSFMHNKMFDEKDRISWLPFTPEEVKDYPLEKLEY